MDRKVERVELATEERRDDVAAQVHQDHQENQLEEMEPFRLDQLERMVRDQGHTLVQSEWREKDQLCDQSLDLQDWQDQKDARDHVDHLEIVESQDHQEWLVNQDLMAHEDLMDHQDQQDKMVSMAIVDRLENQESLECKEK